MKTYEIEGPGGKVYRIEGPDDATDAELISHVKKSLAVSKPVAESPKKTVELNAAQGLFSVGPIADAARFGEETISAAKGAWNSLKQLGAYATGGDTASLKKEREQLKADDAARAKDDVFAGTGLRPAQRIAAEIGLTAPVGAALAVPFRAAGLTPVANALSSFGSSTGANPVSLAGRIGDVALRSGAGAVTGAAASGLTDPNNVGLGAAIGGAVPILGAALSAAGESAGKMIAPRTQKGADKISNEIIRKAALDEARVAQNLANPPKSIAPLSFNEVADDRGIGNLVNTLRNKNPEIKNAIGAFEDAQNAKRFQEFLNMSGGEEGIQRLKDARAALTDPLREKFLASGAEVGTMGVRSKVKDIAESGAFNRKAIKNAVDQAIEPFNIGSDGAKAWARKLPIEDAWYARQNIDDLLAGASNKVNQNAARAASSQLEEIRGRLSTALEKASPEFKAFSNTFREESKKVDAAETLFELLKKAATGTRDASNNPVLSAAQLQNALKNIKPKDWASMTAEQRGMVGMLSEELSRAVRVRQYGTIPGQSATAANLYAQMDPRAGSLLSSLLPDRASGLLGMVQAGVDKVAPNRVPGLLGEKLLDPAMAARAFVPPPLMAPQAPPLGLPYRTAPLLLPRE